MNNEIDIIIYWVDGSDPKWLKDYSRFKDTPPRRFRDLGLLKYIFRCIDFNMPWVRHVHFITNGQLPEWMDTECDKLKHHTHQDIFLYKEALPVFNSSSIEANFANIPNLSDKFILFNDDMIVLKPVSEDRFFYDNLPVDCIKLSFPRKGILYEKIKPQNTLACKFINNAYDYIGSLELSNLEDDYLFSKNYTFKTRITNLFWSFFKKVYWFDIYHHPQAHLKKTWTDFYELHKDSVLKDTSFSRFRKSTDINQYLYRFRNLMKGNFYPHEYTDHKSIYVSNVNNFIRKFDDGNFDTVFLCISEDENITDDDFKLLKNFLISKMNFIFSDKSCYEK